MSIDPIQSTDETASEITAWSRYKWPAIVVALLGGHVVIVTGALLLSSTLIPGASVAPSGYAEALAWDELKAARQASEALGWTLTVTPTDKTELNGDRWVTFSLHNAAGEPVVGAELAVILYHHSRPHEPIEVGAAPSATTPGDYVAAIRLRREGTWRLEAVATRDKNRFLVESDLWIDKPPQGAS